MQPGNVHNEESDKQTDGFVQDPHTSDSELPELTHKFPIEDAGIQETEASRLQLMQTARRHMPDHLVEYTNDGTCVDDHGKLTIR